MKANIENTNNFQTKRRIEYAEILGNITGKKKLTWSTATNYYGYSTVEEFNEKLVKAFVKSTYIKLKKGLDKNTSNFEKDEKRKKFREENKANAVKTEFQSEENLDEVIHETETDVNLETSKSSEITNDSECVDVHQKEETDYLEKLQEDLNAAVEYHNETTREYEKYKSIRTTLDKNCQSLKNELTIMANAMKAKVEEMKEKNTQLIEISDKCDSKCKEIAMIQNEIEALNSEIEANKKVYLLLNPSEEYANTCNGKKIIFDSNEPVDESQFDNILKKISNSEIVEELSFKAVKRIVKIAITIANIHIQENEKEVVIVSTSNEAEILKDLELY